MASLTISNARTNPFQTGTASRAGSRLVCRSSSGKKALRKTDVVAAAHLEPKKLSQAALSAVAAGCIALQLSGPAFATESGIMPSRNRDEDNAARAMLDKKEAQNDSPDVQSRMTDKNSGDVDTFSVAGVAQADAREPKGKFPMKGPNEKASLDEQVDSLPSTRGNSNSEAAKKLDPKAAIEAANDRSAPVSFSMGGASLQVNVGTFGTGDVGTLRDQANDTEDKAKAALSNPVEAAEQTADRTQRAANKTLVNPAGEEQSKEAAEKVSEANAEIPEKLSKGFNDLKKQLTQPTALRSFDGASMQHTTQGVNFWQYQQYDVRVGDLQSITGGQAKKAGSDEAITPDSKGGSDDQLITNESTSGAKARGAAGNPNDEGAADRAVERKDELTNDDTKIP